MKKYQMLAVALLATCSIVSAEETVSVTGSVSVTATSSPAVKPRMENVPVRAMIKEERKEMIQNNVKERVELNTNVRAGVKAASTTEDKQAIRENAKVERKDMREENKTEREEFRVKAKAEVKGKIISNVSKLNGVVTHFENALTRVNTFITNKKASSTVDVTKAESLSVAAKVSLDKVKTNIAAVSAFSSVEITADNKEALKTSLKTAQESIKTFQQDLKNLLEEVKKLK
jgi:hypothetical protein